MDHPTVIIVTGLPGTGKTTFAKYLSQALHLPMIGKDDIKELLFDSLGWNDREWSKKIGIVTYHIMDYVLEEQLKAGHSLILESNFKPEFDDEKFQKLQNKYNFKAVQILFEADSTVLFNRFKQRAFEGGDILDMLTATILKSGSILLKHKQASHLRYEEG